MKWKYVLAIFIFAIGVAGQVFYDFYYTPYIAANEVVKVKSPDGYLPKNYKLTRNDLYVDKVPTSHIPSGAITKISEAENQITNVDLTDGSILTATMINIDNLHPVEGEGIFAIPKEAIFAVNGSLRVRDKVDVYLIRDFDSGRQNTEVMRDASSLFLESVTVVHVRSDSNNDVQDTETGAVTDRKTSTGNISSPELKLKNEEGQALLKKIEEGYKLWIVRVD